VAAVDLAEWLVEQGMPFRQAHAVVGSLVRDSLERGVPLSELVQSHPSLGTEAMALLEPGVAVTRRTTPGGAGPGPVATQQERFRHRLELDTERVRRAGEGAARAAHGSGAVPSPGTASIATAPAARRRRRRGPRSDAGS
jgi:argininosuccinate lyase